jgi:hypothetical protein
MNHKKIVFFDIETASGYETLDALGDANPRMYELWCKRAEYLRTRFEENKALTDDELYLEKAALSAEFSRIVCATFGRIEFHQDEILGESSTLVLKSYSSKNEIDILKGINQVFDKFKGFKFCGHNIKRFDIPFICKRLIINDIPLPSELQIIDKKPWEIPFLDTSEQWGFGAWQESYTSLDLLCTVLNIESPKDSVEGKDVSKHFWMGQLNEITNYCEKDVAATAKCFLKLNGLPVVKDVKYRIS